MPNGLQMSIPQELVDFFKVESGQTLLNDPEVRKAYLGISG